MARPGHRFSYHDFFSGNVSLPAAIFRRVGGFDEVIKVRLEDYELGIRLLKAGARFIFRRKPPGTITKIQTWNYGWSAFAGGDRHRPNHPGPPGAAGRTGDA